jgi:hypothetical protein
VAVCFGSKAASRIADAQRPLCAAFSQATRWLWASDMISDMGRGGESGTDASAADRRYSSQTSPALLAEFSVACPMMCGGKRPDIQRIASWISTRSSTRPSTDATFGSRSTGEMRQSTKPTLPSFSRRGACGWRRASQRQRASPRTTHNAASRRNMEARLAFAIGPHT